MSKMLTTITGLALALVIFSAPLGYQEWKDDGNSFAGGFEGFVSYFSWLTPENQAKYIEQGEFDRFGDGLSGQLISDWQKQFAKDWSNGRGYSYRVQ